MARPSRELTDVARRYVCVRVTNMAGVDLSAYRFDYDLTFAALLMNADGTTYHRYGTRDHASATARLSIASLVRLLRETLEDHAAYEKKPAPPGPAPRRTIEDIPAMARKLQKEKVNCFHCHMVNDAEREQAQVEKRWVRDETLGMWPLPEKIGLVLDRDDPVLIRAVGAGSPAAAAGLRPGDRLLRLGGVRVRSQADVQWALVNASGGAAEVPIEHEREGDMVLLGKIALESGWKRADLLEFSWRPSVWGLRPAPGFGGSRLSEDEVRALGLPAGTFASKVSYIVDWGEHSADGRNARKAGLREGDILLSAEGKSDFISEVHFQSWFRFTRKPGTRVELEVLRKGKKVKIEMPVLP